MKVILVDDKSIALDVLKRLLSRYDGIEVLGCYTDPQIALEEIKSLDIDVVFLDIELGAKDGIEMAQHFINQKPSLEVVFVTAYSKYAVEAFEVNALDYLLKPIQENRLDRTIERLEERFKKGRYKEERAGLAEKYLKIKSFGRFELVDNRNKNIHWRTQKSKELFAYLWVQRSEYASKSLIIEELFPDKEMDKASTILHTTVYQIRKALERLGFPDGIIYKNDSYRLNVPIISDRDSLYELLGKEKLREGEIHQIYRIYNGDFLQEESYSWAMNIQQKIRDLVFHALGIYIDDRLRNKDLTSDLKLYIDTLINIDPFRECAIRYMIEYYGLNDMQVNLKDFYQNYKRDLWDEMKLHPSESTVNLYNRYMGVRP